MVEIDLRLVVWISEILIERFDLMVPQPFTSDELERSEWSSVAATGANSYGEHFPSDAHPPKMYVKRGYPKIYKHLGDLFCTQNFWHVSCKCKSILEVFDLGETEFLDVCLLQKDRKTPIAGSYYTMNFNSQKSAFLAHESQPQIESKFNPHLRLRSDLTDYDLAVSSDALSGADLWVDPNLKKSLFLSDQLVSALRAAGLSKSWRLRKCRIVWKN